MSNTIPESGRPRVWVNSITFSDGTTINLSNDDIVVFVGPNNTGKSVALRDIVAKSRARDAAGTVVTDVDVAIAGTESDLLRWLDDNSHTSFKHPENPTFARMGASTSKNASKKWWHESEKGLHELANFFACHLTTEARLAAANPAPNIKLIRDPKSHPIHYLQANDELEHNVSNLFRQAFGEDLIVHRNAGNEVPLHCGERPSQDAGEDRVSLSYLAKLEDLPTLDSQGDGMRSFVGVLLHSVVVDHTVVLIDEPEAFLHPPQARTLGQMLVQETPSNRQLFIATHSGDLLRGLLDSSSSRVRVVRIQRSGSTNPVTELDNDGVTKVWGDPLLRYSNVLDGLFHSAVVLCEGDSDCRFYAAMLDAIGKPGHERSQGHLMFLHCGGKARMPVVITALRNLDVPVVVVADFDVLNDEKPLKDICEAGGVAWASLRDDWALMKKSIDARKPELQSGEVIKEINEVLAKVGDGVFPTTAKRDIEKVLRRSSPWATAKSTGKAFVPRGEPTTACNRLLTNLESQGVHVVSVGEMECFCPSVGNHGPKWVNIVLTKDLANDDELEAAREFVRGLFKSHGE